MAARGRSRGDTSIRQAAMARLKDEIEVTEQRKEAIKVVARPGDRHDRCLYRLTGWIALPSKPRRFDFFLSQIEDNLHTPRVVVSNREDSLFDSRERDSFIVASGILGPEQMRHRFVSEEIRCL